MAIIRISKATLLDERNGEIVLEIPSLKPAHLDLGKKPEWVDLDTNERRELDEREVADLEACLDEFHKLSIGRALAAVIKL